MKVADIMFDRLTKISSEASVLEAAQLLKKKGFGALLVIEDTEVIGIVTSKDFVWKLVAKGGDAAKVKIKEIMSKPLVMIESEASIQSAADLLTKYGIKRLVVRENDDIVGIISTSVIGKNFKKIAKK